MNKKLLGLVMAVVIATTSLPAITASAATSKVSSVAKTNTATLRSAPYPWIGATALTGAKLYSRPYSDCYSWTVQDNTSVSFQSCGNNWFKVKFDDGSIYYSWRLDNIEQ